MLKIVCFWIAVSASVPLWSQVEPSASGGGFSLDDTHMMTPPPVSGNVYPVAVGSESHTNYFDAGIGFTGSHVDNLLGGNSQAVSDEVYYFVPTVALDRRTPRQGETLHYSPGFTLYQNTSQLNGVSQNASVDYRFHISSYAVIEVGDDFQQNSNLYNQSGTAAAGGVSGTPGSPNTILIAPFADQLSNSSNAGITYQYGRNSMIGGSGSYSFYHYSSESQTQGLNNQNVSGAIGFFSRRIARSEYVGVAYQFSKFITHPTATYSVAHTVFGFYTHYFSRSFSLSLLAGPQHYAAWSPTAPTQESWTPAVQASFGWQTARSNLAASYSHIVGGAPGLIGTYQADIASLNGRLLFSHAWSVGANAQYWQGKGVNPGLFAYAGGHTVSGGVDLQYKIMEGLGAGAGYDHFHQSYADIPATTSSPDSNRVFFSISYGFRRPLGQ